MVLLPGGTPLQAGLNPKPAFSICRWGVCHRTKSRQINPLEAMSISPPWGLACLEAANSFLEIFCDAFSVIRYWEGYIKAETNSSSFEITTKAKGHSMYFHCGGAGPDSRTDTRWHRCSPRGPGTFQRYFWWRGANVPATTESLLGTYIHWPPYQEWPNNTVLMPSMPDRTWKLMWKLWGTPRTKQHTCLAMLNRWQKHQRHNHHFS